MIEEKFLIAAVSIKRAYISVVSDIAKYEKRISQTKDRLASALDKVSSIQKKMDTMEGRKGMDAKDYLMEIYRIVSEIEDEGKAIEKFVEPLNKDIERLSIEESDLYRMICDAHPDMSESEIVEEVSQRLKKEGLL
jgi:hypothetical protein